MTPANQAMFTHQTGIPIFTTFVSSASTLNSYGKNLANQHLIAAIMDHLPAKPAKQKKIKWRYHLRFRKRRRGTAIVDNPNGILVVSEDGKTYSLPGGAAVDGETRKDAAIRELAEETGLKADQYTYLFECASRIQRSIKGGFFQDAHKVYLIKTLGEAKPQNEIKYIAYASDAGIQLSGTTKRIITKYYQSGVKL